VARYALSTVVGGLASLIMPALPVAAQTAQVHPLAEILAAGPRFLDLAPDAVTVELETKVPVVCAVVFGPTTAYGGIATDSDMAGGAHTMHHPMLKGLQPATTYQLRMQGVGPDGTLYVSDNFTLKTPAVLAAIAPAKPQGKNIALASAGTKVSAVSSNFGGGGLASAYGATKAIDGDPATEWSSNGDGDKAWIELDLGRPQSITSLGFYTRTMGTTAEIGSFQVKTDKGQVLGPFTIPDAKRIYYFPVSATAQKLRFEVVKSSGGNTGASEIEVYAGP
jgi:hypothetical protein